MKKIGLLLLSGILVFIASAQKENGTVYIEHEAIAKTKAMWAAFVKGDKETFKSFFADTVYQIVNNKPEAIAKKDQGSSIEWWKGFENLSITDDKPAFPDAIDYKEGGLWVQDWLLWKGTHKETGINLNLKFHNLYSFNEDGKINSMHLYFDDDVLEEIDNSGKTIENGKIFINHPYIVTVRKLVNAYCKEDIESIKGFFAPEAVFSSIWEKDGQFTNLEKQLKDDAETFAVIDNINFEQKGYPDCIYYAKDDSYQVLSYWVVSYTDKDGKKHEKIPYMFTHIFNPDGKIVYESVYVSANHFQ